MRDGRTRGGQPAIGGSAMTTEAKHMLRAIRDQVDRDGSYGGSDHDAASRAGVTLDEARRLLRSLASAKLIQLRRRAAR